MFVFTLSSFLCATCCLHGISFGLWWTSQNCTMLLHSFVFFVHNTMVPLCCSAMYFSICIFSPAPFLHHFGALFLFAPLFNSAGEFLPFDSSLMICFYISLGIYEFFLALMLLQQHF